MMHINGTSGVAGLRMDGGCGLFYPEKFEFSSRHDIFYSHAKTVLLVNIVPTYVANFKKLVEFAKHELIEH